MTFTRPPTYYKYTTGEAFTLDRENYVGPFHIENGIAYAGIREEPDRQILESKNTLLNDIFIKKYEFDNLFDNPVKLEKNYSNLFDILNKESLDTLLGKIHNNNLLVYKSMLGYNPNVFTFSNNFHFYGLSSTNADTRNDDTPSGKKVYTHIDPFSFDSNLFFLDDPVISSNIFIKTDESFEYGITTENGKFSIFGSFVDTSPLTHQPTVEWSPSQIHLNINENKIYAIEGNEIRIYDYKSYVSCGTRNLVDIITLDNVNLIRFGDRYRVEVGSNEIRLVDKEGKDVMKTYDFSELGIDDLIDIEIRDVDDYIIALHRKNGSVYLTQIYDGEFSTNEINDVGGVEAKIKFSYIDSNLFYLTTSEDLQSRLLSYPKYPAGKINESSLLYLRDYIYSTTFERFGKIQIKWNSNSLKSNYLNPLNIEIGSRNHDLYVLLHNIGRLYVSKQNSRDIYDQNIPMDLEKNFSTFKCSESSLGLQLNVEIYKLVDDLLKIYTLSNKKIEYGGSDDRIENIIKNLEIDMVNLHLNVNETINVISIQRILDNILEIQSELISQS